VLFGVLNRLQLCEGEPLGQPLRSAITSPVADHCHRATPAINLKEDVLAGMNALDWHSDPHIKLYCQLAAEQNRSMRCLREALLTRLRFEGNTLTIESRTSDPALKALFAQTRADLQLITAETLVATKPSPIRKSLHSSKREPES
jgi:hypothetical protein